MSKEKIDTSKQWAFIGMEAQGFKACDFGSFETPEEAERARDEALLTNKYLHLSPVFPIPLPHMSVTVPVLHPDSD